MSQQPTFETWAIVELFGHQIIAGLVSEQIIAGQGFVRVDVPGIDGQDPYTKMYGPNAIYCITPSDEATVRVAVESLHPKPIEVWKLNLPQLQAPQYEDDDDGAEDWV